MKERPRNINAPILNRAFATEVFLEGGLIAVGTMTAFQLGLSMGNTVIASTMAFATLCLSRLLHGFNCRSKESLFRVGLFTNKFIWLSILLGYLILKFVLTFDPIMHIFEIAPLTTEQYIIVYLLSLMPLIIVQIYKTIFVR
jgi:Ca2+-transporting ATPase